jgi:predicted permease
MGKNSLMPSLNLQSLSEKKKESLFTALYIGALFIILAFIYFIHLSDNLWDSLVNFFTTLTLAPVPNTGISLPAPSTPANFGNLYVAAFQFSIALGILEIIILTLRVLLRSSFTRVAETIENIVFWFGASYLIIAYLVNMRIASEWFVFWAGMILIFGLALIARAFVILAKK